MDLRRTRFSQTKLDKYSKFKHSKLYVEENTLPMNKPVFKKSLENAIAQNHGAKTDTQQTVKNIINGNGFRWYEKRRFCSEENYYSTLACGEIDQIA